MAADHFCLKWNNFHNSIVSAFENLQSSEDFVDVTLMCEGQNVKAHKVILSACSPYFRNLFKEIPCPHPVIILKDALHSDLVAIIQFMYQGEVLIPQDGLASFLKTAEILQVSGLAGNTATPRIANENVEAILPTQSPISQPLIPQPLISPPFAISPLCSPAKLSPATKNHSSPATEPVQKITKEKESAELGPPILTRFEPASEPLQSCSYDPPEDMVIKTEQTDVDFQDMDYSMTQDTTNDSAVPTEEQSILERSLKAHGTQNLFILNEPNSRQIIEKEKIDRYMPSNAKSFIKCPYCCKSMLRKSFKHHMKICTFTQLKIVTNHDKSSKNGILNINTVKSDQKTVKPSLRNICPQCHKTLHWKQNLEQHLLVCKFKQSVDKYIASKPERVTRSRVRKSLDCRSYVSDMTQLEKTRRNARKSLDCRSFMSEMAQFEQDAERCTPATPTSLADTRSICSIDSHRMKRKRRSSTRKSVDCRNCAGCC